MANNDLDVFRGFSVEKMDFVHAGDGIFQLRVRVDAENGGCGYFLVSAQSMNVQANVQVGCGGGAAPFGCGGGGAAPLVGICSWGEVLPKDSVD